MRKAIYILLVVIMLFAASMYFIRFSKGNTKGPPNPGYSRTISESKDKGLFQFEVVPEKSHYILDNGLSLQVDTAWVENGWSKQHYIFTFGTPPFDKHNWWQLIMNLRIVKTSKLEKDQFRYYVGFKQLDTFVHYRYIIAENGKLKVPLFRDTLAHPHSKHDRIAFDSISFVKRTKKMLTD